MTEVDRATDLLDPEPLALEMGIERLASGQLHVAARTDMHGCKGDMLEWWFRFAPDTRQYAWWHPLDHLSSAWLDTSPYTHVGSTHVVEEHLCDDEVHALQIHFVDPAELFDAEAVERARAQGHVSGLVCAQLGFGSDPPRDERGRPRGARMAHIARDTSFGLVLRSRFWLGAGLDLDPRETARAIPDDLGLRLLKHAYTEFMFLARFLPALAEAERRDETPVTLPW